MDARTKIRASSEMGYPMGFSPLRLASLWTGERKPNNGNAPQNARVGVILKRTRPPFPLKIAFVEIRLKYVPGI